jgi:hypothetical protein
VNLEKLYEAEASFLMRYPQGFADEAMRDIRKKHNVDKLVSFAQENLTKANCKRPEFVVDTVVKLVSRSSMVSRFEKPPFRTFTESLDSDGQKAFASAVEKRLHGAKQRGFEEMLAMLTPHKIAKWAVMSVVPFYHAPRREAFVKPTTAKGILRILEVTDLHYHASPSWAFYKGYQALLTTLKKEVSPALSPNNAAFTGFLMMQL